MQKILFLLPLTVFSWELQFNSWSFSDTFGSVLAKYSNSKLISALPDRGFLNTYKLLGGISYCSKLKTEFYSYKIPYETVIPVAVLQCSENTFITVDRELGSVSYLYLENSKRIFYPKPEILSKAEVIYEEFKGGDYYLPYPTYILREDKKTVKSLTPLERR